MKRDALRTLAAAAAFFMSAIGAVDAGAASVLPLDLDQIVAGAQHIVHVRCTGNSVQADQTIGVVTVTTFVVLDRAKGAASPTLTVRQPGGELNGIGVDYHVPKFSPGDEYVLFMPASSKLGLASPVGLSQGAFDVVRGSSGKEVGNGRDFAELLVGADPATVPPGILARLKLAPPERKRIDLNDFMTLVRTKAGAK
jgi:hypothetical protein